MEDYDKLMVGDQSTDGRIIIADKDRLCYLVKSGSKGSFSIRTISKQLLGEFIDYYKKNPNKKAEDARLELKELSDIDKYEYGYNATLTAMAKMVLDPKNELVRKGNPAESSRAENHLLKTTGLQQIYYGAPGTGKSKTIKDLTFGESVIRTTFHPDSDYASFVGTYKPITEEVDLRDCNGKKVIDDDTKEVVKEERIAYKFIPQAFLEAYVKAWKKLGSSKKQYLIIEEINRGIAPKSLVTFSNCWIATNMAFLIILSLQIRICRSISKRNLRDGRLRIKTKSTSSMAKPIW